MAIHSSSFGTIAALPDVNSRRVVLARRGARSPAGTGSGSCSHRWLALPCIRWPQTAQRTRPLSTQLRFVW